MRSSKLVLMSLVFAGGFVGSSLVAAQDMSSTSTSAAQTSKAAAATKDYSFEALDKHHHGYLVRSDIPHSMKALRLHFDEADYNHDGRLSPAEYAASRQQFNENDVSQQTRAQQGSAYANQVQNAQAAKEAESPNQGPPQK